MTDLPNMKIKALVSFPSTAIGGTGIDVVKTNGNFIVNIDYSEFAFSGTIPPGSNALVWDSVSNTYILVPPSAVGGISDAPSDSILYGRKNAAWVDAAVPLPATVAPPAGGVAAVGVSLKYAREDHVHPAGASGSGDVVGPAGSAADRVAVFDGVTGKVIKDGGVTIAEIAGGGGGLLAANNLSDVADTATSFRNLGGMDMSTPIVLTGATTLTSTAFSRFHVISGTSANYTVTLPTPVGNSGALIALMVAVPASASKLYTVASPSGKVGRQTSLVMWASESLLIRSNGVDWNIIEARQIPFVGLLSRSTDQTVTPSTITKINMLVAAGDPAGLNLCYDAANTAFKAPRIGVYIFNVYTYLQQTGSPTFAQCWVSDGSGAQFSGVFSYTGSLAGATLYGTAMNSLLAGDLRSIGTQGNGATATVLGSGIPSRLEFAEVCPSW